MLSCVMVIGEQERNKLTVIAVVFIWTDVSSRGFFPVSRSNISGVFIDSGIPSMLLRIEPVLPLVVYLCPEIS